MIYYDKEEFILIIQACYTCQNYNINILKKENDMADENKNLNNVGISFS